MNLGDLFNYDKGQERTKALNSWLNESLDYYLGPTGIPDKVRSFNALINPIAQMHEAGGQTVVAFDPTRPTEERLGAAINAGVNTLAAAAPAIGGAIAGQPARQAVMETLANVTGPLDDRATRFIADEDGSFGGIRALTADHAALARAEDMAAAGASRDDIWNATGWFRGVDGKWRFEIDDSAATLNDYITSGAVDEWTPYDSIRMPETLSHDALYSAYPDMADIRSTGRVKREIDSLLSGLRGTQSNTNARGYYDPTRRGINLTTSADDMRPVALHELQHDIQRTEGFATGGAPSKMTPKRADADSIDWGKISPLMQKYGIDGDESYGGAMMTLNRIRDEMFLQNAPFSDIGVVDAERVRIARMDRNLPSGYELYRRLAGEAEARNVEARRDFTPEERRASPPWQTLDVPEDKQIVQFGGGGPQASADPITQRGDEVLGLLSSGRANEVTDAMLDLGDPVSNTRLNQYLFNNYDLPMDEASRMARAEEMGFDVGTPLYHGAREDINAMDRYRGSSEGGQGAFFTSDEPSVANTYASRRAGQSGENVIPLLADVRNYGEAGYISPFPVDEANIDNWLAGLDKFNRSLDYSKPSYFERAIQSARNADQSGVAIRQVEDDAVSSHLTMPSDVYVTFDPRNIRSRFARFDPRLAHLSNLNASLGGLTLGGLLGLQGYQDDTALREYLKQQ